MEKAVKLRYEDGRVSVIICFDGQCYRAVYEVLDREEFEKRLALLIGEAGADAVISYEEGDLPKEP